MGHHGSETGESEDEDNIRPDSTLMQQPQSNAKLRFPFPIFIWSCLVVFLVLVLYPSLLAVRLPVGLLPTWKGAEPEAKPPEIEKLAPFAFEPLPLGSIKPEGWMRDQLELMANGLAGHQYDFYNIVKHSPWLGGHSEYAVLNEGLPYWLNGLVPLAYGLGDERLQKQVLEVVDEVLNRQWEDGWLGPERGRDRDIWARFPLCLGLIQVVEAVPNLAERVVPALHRFVKEMHRMLREGRAYWDQWGQVRYPDMLVTLQWLYEKHPKNNTDELLASMRLLKETGFDWPGYWTNSSFIFKDLDLVKPAIDGDTFKFRHSHSVNVGQGLSAGAAVYRFTKNESLLDVNRRGVNWTFTYHGDVAGSIIGDERESGLGPNRGSELCTASETMYSLSYLYHVIGDKEFADRCELAAYNAWPVSITADHWARQYLAVANDPAAATIDGQLNFWNTGPDSLVYGLDTNYPCCTVNMPQGLPKFLSASFVRVGENGIGHSLLGPASVKTTTTSGIAVNVSCHTDYPFGESFTYTVESSSTFNLHLRAPSWHGASTSLTLKERNKLIPIALDERTGMASISLNKGEHTLNYNIETTVRATPRSNSSVAIYRGALLYALDIGEAKTVSANTLPSNKTVKNMMYGTLNPTPVFPDAVKKVEITNTKPWNIGIDPSTLTHHTTKSDQRIANPIYDYQAPPGYITGKGCLIDWPLHNGLPKAFTKSEARKRKCTGKAMDVVLRPYASLKVHMAELPVVDLSTASD